MKKNNSERLAGQRYITLAQMMQEEADVSPLTVSHSVPCWSLSSNYLSYNTITQARCITRINVWFLQPSNYMHTVPLCMCRCGQLEFLIRTTGVTFATLDLITSLYIKCNKIQVQKRLLSHVCAFTQSYMLNPSRKIAKLKLLKVILHSLCSCSYDTKTKRVKMWQKSIYKYDR